MPLALNYSGVRGNDFSTATTTRDAVGVKLTLWRIVYLLNALKFSHRKQKILNFTLRKKKKKYEIFNIEETSATAVGKKKLKKKTHKKSYIHRRISYENLSLLGALIINFSVTFLSIFYTHTACRDSILTCAPHSCCCSNHRNNRPPSIE